jgi:hypothetical protein
MALTFQWLLEHIELASQASSVNEIRMRNAIVIQRIQQEIQKGETEPPPSLSPDTKELDEAWNRLEQTAQKPDIDAQMRRDLLVVLANLDCMYQIMRWGKK